MRNEKVMIRVTQDEKDLLREAAARHGLPVASWARINLIREASARKDYLASPQFPQPHEPLLLSLFSGAGGLDLGFEEAGFHVGLAFDVDAEAVRTFNENRAHRPAHKRDVGELTCDELDTLVGSNFEPVGVIGGPPCQSFSVSNVHQKNDDPRHQLAMHYARLLEELNARRPVSFFLFENVPGLLGKKHHARFESFKRAFETAGFEVQDRILDAKHYGVPQERKRVFIIGINRLLHPRAQWIPPKAQPVIRTVRMTISGLPEPVHNARGLDPESFPVHPNHWCLVPRSDKFKNADLSQGQAHGRSFRTLSWDRPSWAVAYGHREVHVHPEGHRRLSIYEAMLLQSFPRSYRLTGNMTAQIRLVSEAVPVRLAHALAVSIRESLGV